MTMCASSRCDQDRSVPPSSLAAIAFYAVLLALSVSCCAVLVADEPPAPVAEEPPAPAKDVAAPAVDASPWVEQLGDESYAVRDAAATHLRGLGEAAHAALLEGLKRGDPQVQRSCRRILADVMEQDYEARLAAFVADKRMTQDHDLPGWTRYRELVGKTDTARQLFIDMQREERGLLASAEAGSGAASDALRMRFRQIYQQMNQRDSRARQTPSEGSIAALLFVASDPALDLPEELVGHSYWANLVRQQTFQQPLEKGPQRVELKKLLGAWLLTDSGIALLQQKIMLAIQYKLEEGLILAMAAIEDKAVHANYRAYAITAIGALGGKDFGAVLLSLLEDKSECVRRVVRRGNKQEVMSIELRDVALAWIVYLTGQTHADYHLPQAKAAFDRFKQNPQSSVSVGNLGFESKEDRDKAFEKLRTYLADHPLPENEEKIADIRAKAKAGKFSSQVNAAAFQPNIFFGPARTLDDDGDENQIGIADRQFIRQLKTSRLLIADQQYSEAAALLGAILAAPEDFIFQPDRDIPLIRGFKAEAERLLGESPPSGLEAYQRLYGPEARRKLDEAIRKGDRQLLAEVTLHYFYSDEGAEAAYLLGCHYLDRGHPLRAALYFQRILERPNQGHRFEPALSLRLAACWAMAGMRSRAEETLVALRQSGRLRAVEIAGQEQEAFAEDSQAISWLEQYIGPQKRFRQGFGWLTQRGAADRNAQSEASGPYLVPHGIAQASNDAAIRPLVAAIEKEKLKNRDIRLPSCAPIIAGNVVALRLADRTLALDFETSELLWEIPHDDSLRHLSDHAPAKRKQEKADFLREGLELRLWDNPTYGGISSDGDRLFCVEDLAFGSDDYHRLVVTRDGRQQLDTGVQKSHNTLAAYDLQTGKLQWEIGGADGVKSASLTGVFFLGPPLALGGRLYVMGLTGPETQLIELESATGEVLSRVPLHYRENTMPPYMAPHLPSWVFENPARRSGASPSAAHGVLICPLSGNDFAAVDLTSQQVLWMYRPQEEEGGEGTSRFGNAWQQKLFEVAQRDFNDRWADCLPCVSDDCVILTPTEAGEMYCLNLRDGGLKWLAPRRDGFYVAGAVDGVVLVIGRSSVWALRLDDGSPVWPQGDTLLPPGASPTGRGYMGGGHYYLPLSTGEVAAIDLATGALAARSLSPSHAVPGNLVAVRGTVFSQTALGVERFETLAARNQKLQTLAGDAMDPATSDPKMLLDQGEILLFQGRLREAAAVFQQVSSSAKEPVTRQKAVEMLHEAIIEGVRVDFETFIKLAEETPLQGVNRLRMLREMGDAYALAGRSQDAFDIFLQLAEAEKLDELRYVSAGRKVRTDRALVSRIEGLLASLQPRLRDQLQNQLADLAQSKLAPAQIAVLARNRHLNPLRLQEAIQFVKAKQWPAAQSRLQLLLEQGDAAQRRGAIALLAEHYHATDRPEAAARCFAVLLAQPDTACYDDRTAAQLVAALPADSATRRQLEPTAPAEPAGEPTKKIEKKAQPVEYRYPVFSSCSDPAIDADLSFEIDNQGRNLACQDHTGRNLWTAALPAPGANWKYSSSVYSHSRAVLQGDLLLLWTCDRVLGIDALAGKVLWHHDTITSESPYPGMYRQPPMWLAMVRSGDSAIGGQISPLAVSADTVVFQRERELTAVDPTTGKILWSREGVAEYCDLFGDNERLFVTPPSDSDTMVLNLIDGAEIARRQLPDRDRRLGVAGGRLLLWTTDAVGAEISLLDPWTNQTLWRKACGLLAQPWYIDQDEVAVLEPEGELQLLAVDTGQQLLKMQLPAVKDLRNLLVWKGANRYLVVANGSEAAAKGGQVFGVQVIMGSVNVNGTVAMIDTQGKLLWSKKVLSQTARIHQPDQFPVLAFLSQTQVQQGRSIRARWQLLCLDKRNGKVIHDETTDGSNNLYQILVEGDDQAVIKTRVQAVRFDFAQPAKK
ncbi:outer membrane protein assembly factor BamB family protein [Lignipirellula cremea]|uniref:Outer membrane biogenesis protein BamB n=1 Tax=Lignipirellula cremea TaxID=2528010 RepID=A0A518E1I5_9BACT|nr:PQQ-binding-like beta-propeller repeat protein [Lignipirellula cremea]QDU97957.1 outer membrane biogenesis protein BamB [Lignipirellula cremea]